MTIQEVIDKYKGKIDYLDLEIIIANSLHKTREFILTHPEFKIPSLKIESLKLKVSRRMKGEPVAYLVGHKEFYGLDFIVNKYTLVPRPETELMVEEVIDEILDFLPDGISLEQKFPISDLKIIDIGTGSGCIAVSIAHELENGAKYQISNIKYYATDISKDALKIAKKNAKVHGLDKKIKFLHGNLLEPFLKKSQIANRKSQIILTANLPYLSREIYQSTPVDVKKFEPKSALYSPEQGLQHYRKLLEQISELMITDHWSLVTVLLEISPEQKQPITKLIKSIFPDAKIEFKKDLANKWRTCIIRTQSN